MIIQVPRMVHSVGLTVVATSTENFSANREFYTELCGGKLQASIPNPLDARQQILLLFDAVRNFKNIYNNFLVMFLKFLVIESFQLSSLLGV